MIEAGIEVWTTLDVGELQSQSDSMATAAGVQVTETVPDRVFFAAEEVEFVDLPPENLVARFRDGEVRLPHWLEGQAERVYHRPTLIALRELAMRAVADWSAQGETSSTESGHSARPWAGAQRLLAYMDPQTASIGLVRAAHRLAHATHADWIVAYSEGRPRRRVAESMKRLASCLRLAEQLGAETTRISRGDVVAQLLNYATFRNVARVVVGRERRRIGASLLRRSTAERLTARSGSIDIHVIRSSDEPYASAPHSTAKWTILLTYAKALALMLVATGIAALFHLAQLTDASVVLTYLLAVVICAAGLGRGAAVVSSVVGVLFYNVFFTPPYLTLAVDRPEYIYTFAVMLAVALLVSALTVRIREQSERAVDRERRTSALYRISHRLAGVPGELQLLQAAQEELVSIFNGEIVFFLAVGDGLRVVARRGLQFVPSRAEKDAAEWAFSHGETAGWGTENYSDVGSVFVPLTTRDSTVGVMEWHPESAQELLSYERLQLLSVVGTQVAVALERDRLAQETQHALAQAEAERLRSSLLSVVSHDLRTPLTSIAGSASMLVDEAELGSETRRELAQSIYDEAERLNQLVEDLLQVTRLESGNLRIQAQPVPLDDLVTEALKSVERMLHGRAVAVSLPEEVALVSVDGPLVRQVLVNLLTNAAKYSPEGAPIDVSAKQVEGGVEISVADRGSSLGADEYARVFDRFYQGSRGKSSSRTGSGLGLAICWGIVTAHGGRIWAERREGGGSVFRFVLPRDSESNSIGLGGGEVEDGR